MTSKKETQLRMRCASKMLECADFTELQDCISEFEASLASLKKKQAKWSDVLWLIIGAAALLNCFWIFSLMLLTVR